MANARLGKDIQYLRRHVEAQTSGQAAVTEVDDNMEFVQLSLTPNDGFFKGARLRFKLRFTDCYPMEGPYVQCLDEVYHPNIDPIGIEEISDLDTSNVCVSLLEEWEPGMGLDHIVMALLFLLYNPNPEDCLSPYFDGSLDMGTLEGNIRRALRGEDVEGRVWPRLFVDDVDDEEGDNGNASSGDGGENDDGDACGENRFCVNGDMVAAQTCTDSKEIACEVDMKSSDEDSVARRPTDNLKKQFTEDCEIQSRNQDREDAADETLARTEKYEATEKNLPPAPLETPDNLINSCNGSRTSIHGENCTSQDATNVTNYDNFCKLPLLDNHYYNSNADTHVVTSRVEDFHHIFLDADDRCLPKNSDIKSFIESLGIAKLFSCCNCSCRNPGCGIKALFSCFRHKEARQFLKTAATGAVQSFGDCDVD